ncbi:hypothetical protein N7G274_002286 [Stereocaulon virgatum]|uniref:F-box domain-containing protein n=1 Tax=Stereocaulon virgatum TaxID=373712 RepID=A0ABR4AI95_9LECA
MSALLTLPLEIRQNIYSFLLINRYTKRFLHGDVNFSAHALSLTCRQLYIEALRYYYDHNVFSISFVDHSLCGFCISPGRFPSEIAADSKTGGAYVNKHFKFVQNLQIEMEIFDGMCPVQAEQPDWLCSTLILAKQGQDNNILLKNLQLIICGLVSSSRLFEDWREFTEEETAKWTALFQPLRGKIGTFMIFDRQVPFTEEGLETLGHANGYDDDDEVAGQFDI